MGATSSDTRIIPGNHELPIKIATVKVGQSYSPFQFFLSSNSNSLESNFDREINEKFNQVCKNYDLILSEEEQSILMMLNKQSKGRFTPLFHKHAGVKKEGSLMGLKEFSKEWDRKFEKIIESDVRGYFSKNIEMRSQKITFKLKLFDIICYHAILAYAYDTLDTVDEIASNNYNFKYQSVMDEVFSSPLNNYVGKIRKAIRYATKNKVHVLFLQELTKRGVNTLTSLAQNYRVARTEFKENHVYSVIMISEDLVRELEPDKKHWTLLGFNTQYISSWKFQELNEFPTFDHAYSSTYAVRRLVQNEEEAETGSSRKKRKSKLPKLPNLLNIHNDFGFQNKKTSMDSMKDSEDMSEEIWMNGKYYKINDHCETESEKKMIREFKIIQQSKMGMKKTWEKLDHDKTMKNLEYTNEFGKDLSRMDKKEKKNRVIVEEILLTNRTKLTEDEVNMIKFTSNTVVQFLGNLILISTHLEEEDKEIVSKQMDKIEAGLLFLKNRFPLYTIIMGLDIDVNLRKKGEITFDHVSKLRGNFQCIPDIKQRIPFLPAKSNTSNWKTVRKLFKNSKTFTVNSTKSNFQFDRQQVCEKYLCCNNFIICSKPLQEDIIESIDLRPVNLEETIPNLSHPFTNYLVRGSVRHEVRDIVLVRNEKKKEESKLEEGEKKDKGKKNFMGLLM